LRSLLSWRDALPDLTTPLCNSYLEQISLLCQAAGNVVLASADAPQVLSYMNAGISLQHRAQNAAHPARLDEYGRLVGTP
jgi:hypothetical protein